MKLADIPENAIEARNYTVGDLTELAGLTYRQINDWEARAGILPRDRENADGWRTFNLLEVLALSVCSYLREELELPLEKLGFIYKWLVRPGDSTKLTEEKIEAATAMVKKSLRMTSYAAAQVDQYLRQQLTRKPSPIQMAAELFESGTALYLVSNFNKSLILTEGNLSQFVDARITQKPMIVCALNPIFQRIMKKLGLKSDTFRSYSVPEMLTKMKRELAPDEEKALAAIRDHKYQSVTIHTAKGKIIRIETEHELSAEDRAKVEAKISDLLVTGKYQSFDMQFRDGGLVSLKSKSSTKLDA